MYVCDIFLTAKNEMLSVAAWNHNVKILFFLVYVVFRQVSAWKVVILKSHFDENYFTERLIMWDKPIDLLKWYPCLPE